MKDWEIDELNNLILYDGDSRTRLDFECKICLTLEQRNHILKALKNYITLRQVKEKENFNTVIPNV